MQTKTSVPSVLNILASFCSNKKSQSSATGGCYSSPAFIRSLFAVAFASFALACGGDDDDSAANNGTTCGSGTVEINGQCVPGGECGEGTHSEGGKCVANGGNAGASGSGGSAGSTGSAGAGGSNTGGTAGNGGSSGTSGTAGQSGAGGTGAAGSSGTGGSGGNPLDEPCPDPSTYTTFVNCSDSCGARHPDCRPEGYCDIQDEDPHVILANDPISPLPAALRTPEFPGVDPTCVDWCGADNVVFRTGMAIWEVDHCKEGFNGYPFRPLRVTVSPPWQIALDAYSCSPGFQCMTYTTPWCNLFFDVFTTDPNAPSVNVLYETVEEGVECP